MSNQFLHMQKLAGLITESEYKIKLTEAEDVASKISQNLNRIESLPSVQKAAKEIMSNPELLQQFQQGLVKMGVNIDLKKEATGGESISTSDISRIISKASQIQEEQNKGSDKFINDGEASILKGLFISPALATILAKVAGPSLLASLGISAAPLIMSSILVGVVVGGVAGFIKKAEEDEKKAEEDEANKNKVTESKMTKKELKNKIREMILDEAKKKKKDEEPADVAPQEDIELEVTDTETADVAPQADTTGEVDIDPKVKAIQDSLQKALANAKQLGDEKLVKQIGNTLTMLVRTQVLGATQQGPTEQ